jgi:hypothetical protein
VGEPFDDDGVAVTHVRGDRVFHRDQFALHAW